MNPFVTLVVLATLFIPAFATAAETSAAAIGAAGQVGCLANPRDVERLEITAPGVYENYRLDGGGRGGNLVKITADDVTLRHCEIFGGTLNAVGVFGTRVLIENCRIHHMLAGSYQEQKDSHGISGRWGDVTIRNCDISYTSGDSVQFDPDRRSRGTVTIERCTFWTAPLEADAGGFHRGERPGENAVDTKTMPDGDRSRLIIRDCYFHGWNQPAQIDNVAALNIKEQVEAVVERCVFRDCENALRVRGPGSRGDARVTIRDCAIYQSQVGVRIEDRIAELKITRLLFGPDVTKKYREAGGGAGPGYENTGEAAAPAIETLLQDGFPKP